MNVRFFSKVGTQSIVRRHPHDIGESSDSDRRGDGMAVQ